MLFPVRLYFFILCILIPRNLFSWINVLSTSEYYFTVNARTWTPYRDMVGVAYHDNGTSRLVMEDRYLIIIASFGNNLTESTLINIMLPPPTTNDTLCTYPPSLLVNDTTTTTTVPLDYNNPKNAIYFDVTVPIALLVKRGDCYAEDKANVLLQMAQNLNLTNTLKWLLIYDHNPLTDGDLTQFRQIDDEPSHPSEFDDIGIATVPYRHAQRLQKRIASIANATNLNPIFLHDNEPATIVTTPTNDGSSTFDTGSLQSTAEGIKEWQLVYRISSSAEGSEEYQGYASSPYQNSFFIFRFLLFGILLLSPCIRLGYLWYSGGGRILLRRNLTTGRINGLQYIPPIPWWLTTGRTRTNQGDFFNGQQNNHTTNPHDTVLTEEQFNALPILIYQTVVTKLDHNDDDADDREDEDDNTASNFHKNVVNKNAKEESINNKRDTQLEITEPNEDDTKQQHDFDDDDDDKLLTITTTTQQLGTEDDNIIIRNNTIEEKTLVFGVQRKVSVDDVEKQLLEAAVQVPVPSKPDNNSNTSIDQSIATNNTASMIDDEQRKIMQSAQYQEQQLLSNELPYEEPDAKADNNVIESNDNNTDHAIMTSRVRVEKRSAAIVEARQKVNNNDNNTNTEPLPEQLRTTTCTMCSICIDDFILGERLVLLPRCNHAFHRACIYPWLLERNGCCPLCKTPVLLKPDESTVNDDTAAITGNSSTVTDPSVPSAIGTADNNNETNTGTNTTADASNNNTVTTTRQGTDANNNVIVRRPRRLLGNLFGQNA